MKFLSFVNINKKSNSFNSENFTKNTFLFKQVFIFVFQKQRNINQKNIFLKSSM